MDRLTEKRDGQNVIPLRQDGKHIWSLASAGMGDASTQFLYGEFAEKLSEYEDAEEQGLLLRLPCKMGTIVYAFLPNDNHFTDCQINKIEIKPTIYGNMCYFIEPIAHSGCLYRYFENDIGKTVFLTREGAEQKLKEMESD